MRRCLVLLLLLVGCGGRQHGSVVFDLGRNAGFAEFKGAPDARIDVKENSGVISVFQRSGTGLSYYLKSGSGSYLTFGIGSAGPSRSGGTALCSVLYEAEDGRPPVKIFEDGRMRRIFRKVGLGERVRVRLPDGTGLARITLQVGAQGGKDAIAVWLNPRIEEGSGGVQAAGNQAPPAPASAMPQLVGGNTNFLIVLLDAARADHFGLYGHRKDVTPEIDRLATESVVFRNAYCEAVFTQASVASLLTSEYPDRHGSILKAYGLGPHTRTVTQMLKDAGWETALITASPNASSLYGYDRGFDTVEELYKKTENTKRLVDAHEVVDSAIAWLEQHRDKKFFMYAHIREPHAPHIPPPPFSGKFSSDYPGPINDAHNTEGLYNLVNSGKLDLMPEDCAYIAARYDENLAYADSQVGRLLAWLRTSGLLDRTVIVLLGDHGEGMGEHRVFGHNSRLYREVSHIPLVFHLPSGVPRKVTTVDDVVGVIDVTPTLLDVAGVVAPEGAFQGRSLLAKMAAGASLVPRPNFCRTSGEKPIFGVLDDGFRYMYDVESHEQQVYALGTDPGERVNLVESSPLRTGFLHQEYITWAWEQATLAKGAPATGISVSPEDATALIELGYADPGAGRGPGSSSAEVSAAPSKNSASAEKEPKPKVTPPPKSGKEKKPKTDRQLEENGRHRRNGHHKGVAADSASEESEQ